MNDQRHGGFLIGQIHRLGGRILAKKLKAHGIEINPAQGRIMFVLWQNDGIPIAELAKQTSLGKSTMTSMLDRLEASGYVRRVPSPEDRRVVLIERTEKDRSFQQLYVQISQEMTALFYDGFSAAEIDAFEGYLVRILDNLAQRETASAPPLQEAP
jgi:DNA-binding MarR family transcriptional regulator